MYVPHHLLSPASCFCSLLKAVGPWAKGKLRGFLEKRGSRLAQRRRDKAAAAAAEEEGNNEGDGEEGNNGDEEEGDGDEEEEGNGEGDAEEAGDGERRGGTIIELTPAEVHNTLEPAETTVTAEWSRDQLLKRHVISTGAEHARARAQHGEERASEGDRSVGRSFRFIV